MTTANKRNWPHVCPICGKDFLSVKMAVYCSAKCRRTADARNKFERGDCVKAARARRVDEQRRMKERLMARDAAYAAAFPASASGAVRGRVPTGGRSTGGFRVWRIGEIINRYVER